MGNYGLPGRNINQQNAGTEILQFGKVVANNDPDDGGRIKVRIKGVDDKLNDADVPYAFPLIPKFVNVKPKIGETVMVILPNSDNKFENRHFIGPVISQPQFLNKDNHFLSSQSMLDTGFVEPDQAPSRVPEARGVYSNPEDVSIEGRGNTDMIMKNKEVLIRAGKFVTGNRLRFNRQNPAYIQIKHDANISTEDNDQQQLGTVTNIVSNKINLLTHDKGDPRFDLANREKMIGDEELTNILKDARPVVYGDRLIEFIELLQKYIKNHIHPYPGIKPDEDDTVQRLMEYDLQSLVSENVKVN